MLLDMNGGVDRLNKLLKEGTEVVCTAEEAIDKGSLIYLKADKSYTIKSEFLGTNINGGVNNLCSVCKEFLVAIRTDHTDDDGIYPSTTGSVYARLIYCKDGEICKTQEQQIYNGMFKQGGAIGGYVPNDLPINPSMTPYNSLEVKPTVKVGDTGNYLVPIGHIGFFPGSTAQSAYMPVYCITFLQVKKQSSGDYSIISIKPTPFHYYSTVDTIISRDPMAVKLTNNAVMFTFQNIYKLVNNDLVTCQDAEFTQKGVIVRVNDDDTLSWSSITTNLAGKRSDNTYINDHGGWPLSATAPILFVSDSGSNRTLVRTMESDRSDTSHGCLSTFTNVANGVSNTITGDSGKTIIGSYNYPQTIIQAIDWFDKAHTKAIIINYKNGSSNGAWCNLVTLNTNKGQLQVSAQVDTCNQYMSKMIYSRPRKVGLILSRDYNSSTSITTVKVSSFKINDSFSSVTVGSSLTSDLPRSNGSMDINKIDDYTIAFFKAIEVKNEIKYVTTLYYIEPNGTITQKYNTGYVSNSEILRIVESNCFPLSGSKTAVFTNQGVYVWDNQAFTFEKVFDLPNGITVTPSDWKSIATNEAIFVQYHQTFSNTPSAGNVTMKESLMKYNIKEGNLSDKEEIYSKTFVLPTSNSKTNYLISSSSYGFLENEDGVSTYALVGELDNDTIDTSIEMAVQKEGNNYIYDGLPPATLDEMKGIGYSSQSIAQGEIGNVTKLNIE